MYFISHATFSLLCSCLLLFPPTPCLHSQRALRGRDLSSFCTFRLLTFPSKATQCKIPGHSTCLTSAFGIWEKALPITLLSFSHCTGVSCSCPAALPGRPAVLLGQLVFGHQRWDHLPSSTTPSTRSTLHPAPHAQGTSCGWHLPPRHLWEWEGGLSSTWSLSQGCQARRHSASPGKEVGGLAPACCQLLHHCLGAGVGAERWHPTPLDALFWCFTRLHCTT